MNGRSRLGVIVVAAGEGRRARRFHRDIPKQYRAIGGKAVLAHAIEFFLKQDCIELVLPVIGGGHKELYEGLDLAHEKLLAPVFGGAERQQSTLFGLQALEELAPEHVLIHDAARPFIATETLTNICKALETHDGALPVLPLGDSIKRSADGITVQASENRNQLWAAQTPQGFVFKKLLAAHRRASSQPEPFTDDAGIAQWAGLDVVMVPGSAAAFKITAEEDFIRAGAVIKEGKPMETRVGTGLDIHAFEPGDKVVLGGVEFAHEASLKGHSDADAALHVLTDALLGALAEGDIGSHFPPNEAKWKDTSSEVFLSFAAERVRARGGRIVHLDLTIVCEAPKIAPKSGKVQQNIAKICGISPKRVSVKATTSEKLGFIGRKEGLMSMGAATIEVPRGED